MFRIGEFSKLSRVSVKALRFYDRLGLLRPAHIDAITGRRFYTIDQLPWLHRILALKDLGFTLAQVQRLLDEHIPAAELRGMLRLKQTELAQHVATEHARLERVAARVQLIEQDGQLPTREVVVKPVDPLTIASIRAIAPTIADFEHLLQEINRVLRQQRIAPAGPCFSMFYHHGFRQTALDVEVAIPVDAAAAHALPAQTGGRVTVRTVPGTASMACLVYEGAYTTLVTPYTAIGTWIATNGYRLAGPGRELYLHGPDPSPTITEIQFPVEHTRGAATHVARWSQDHEQESTL